MVLRLVDIDVVFFASFLRYSIADLLSPSHKKPALESENREEDLSSKGKVLYSVGSNSIYISLIPFLL